MELRFNFLFCLLILSFFPFLSGKVPKISKTDRWLMCWWAFTGLTHIILEGYFAFSPEFYKDKSGFYLAEVCKFSSFMSAITILVINSRGDSTCKVPYS